MNAFRISLCALLLGSATWAFAADEDKAKWGDLSGTFIYDGVPPAPVVILAPAIVPPPIDESLLVDPNTKGIANVVVYLRYDGKEPLPIHASYAEAAKHKVKLKISGARFDPHVAAVRSGQRFVIRNRDPGPNNVKIQPLKNPVISPILPAGATHKSIFKTAESLPAKMNDSIHPWMGGYLLVRDDPYFAVTDTDGHFTIKNLPVGTWTFQFWHEKSGYVTKVRPEMKEGDWVKGRVKITIKPGENDLGELSVSPHNFEK